MTGRRSLGWVVAGQFIGALADNALLLVALAVLLERHAAAWAAPALRIAFYFSYVLLSAVAGPVADAVAKKWVLFATNAIKLCGCLVLLTPAHPLLAYLLVGIGGATHAPARYGILSELAARPDLVAANAWMEASTVLALLLGTVWGSLLVDAALTLPFVHRGMAGDAVATLGCAYLAAALCALPVRGAPASNPNGLRHPGALVRNFAGSLGVLWRDPAARVSLFVTCLFWTVAAVLQFAVLQWAALRLGLSLSEAGLLQGVIAVGMIAGAAAAGRWIREERAVEVLPLGLALGAALVLVAQASQVVYAGGLLLGIGVLSGLLLVPMNTVLQRRGLALMHPGQSIAVQNFSENLASLLGLAAYGLAVALGAAAVPTLAVMGVLVGAAMLALLVAPEKFAFRAGGD
jgi:MFS family permease